jgi:uncharacterized CHY-type Zn-finger protein
MYLKNYNYSFLVKMRSENWITKEEAKLIPHKETKTHNKNYCPFCNKAQIISFKLMPVGIDKEEIKSKEYYDYVKVCSVCKNPFNPRLQEVHTLNRS